MRSTCRKCAGQGHIIKNPCTKCKGSGTTLETKTVTVPVPAGLYPSIFCTSIRILVFKPTSESICQQSIRIAWKRKSI